MNNKYQCGQLCFLLSLLVVETTSLPQTNLEYKPNRPPFAGQAGSNMLSQIIPPGKPWPSSAEDQLTTIANRFQETSTQAPATSLGNPSPPSTTVPALPNKYGILITTFFIPFFSGQPEVVVRVAPEVNAGSATFTINLQNRTELKTPST